MYAYVPAVPGVVSGVVSEIPSPLPEGQTAQMYEACGSMVEAGWNFDGSSFTPPAPAAPTAPTANAILRSQAAIALAKSDVTYVRCGKAQPPVAFPAAWSTYCDALRAIVSGADTVSTTLPATPSYPAGT